MYCTKKINEDYTWIGCGSKKISIFEGMYPVPNGMSYNSYLLKDEKTVLFDTVDKIVGEQFLETESVKGNRTKRQAQAGDNYFSSAACHLICGADLEFVR